MSRTSSGELNHTNFKCVERTAMRGKLVPLQDEKSFEIQYTMEDIVVTVFSHVLVEFSILKLLTNKNKTALDGGDAHL